MVLNQTQVVGISDLHGDPGVLDTSDRVVNDLPLIERLDRPRWDAVQLNVVGPDGLIDLRPAHVDLESLPRGKLDFLR